MEFQGRCSKTVESVNQSRGIPMKIALSDFALSHFDASKQAAAIPGIAPGDFQKAVNEQQPVAVLPGYAPFCKLFSTRTGRMQSVVLSL
jgi:hypothetical protein